MTANPVPWATAFLTAVLLSLWTAIFAHFACWALFEFVGAYGFLGFVGWSPFALAGYVAGGRAVLWAVGE